MKTSIKILIFLSILVFIFGVNCQHNQKLSKQLSPAEIEIYNLFLAGKSDETAVINIGISEALGINKPAEFSEILDGVQENTSFNYIKINKLPPKIEKGYKLASGNEIVSESEIEDKELFEHFVFSRVGFSNNGKQAVVWFGENRGALNSVSGFYLLEKEDGIWKIKSESEKLKS